MMQDFTPGYVELNGAQVYNEAAFRRFVRTDLTRARKLQRGLLLVLISVCRQPGRPIALSSRASSATLKGLATSMREVDFVGWFREGSVAAALLVSGAQSVDPAAVPGILARIRKAIEPHLPEASGALRIRVVRLGAARQSSLPS